MKKNPILSHIEQSENWAEFQEKISGGVRKIGKTYLIKHKLPMGFSWLLCSRGKISSKMIGQIKKIAHKSRAIFLRLEPTQNFKFPRGFHKSHASYQPDTTLVLDLKLSEDEILKQMKEKGRYNIHLAERKGVKIELSKNADTFYRLLAQTTSRDKFSSHEKSYYQNLLETLSGEDFNKGFTKLFLATYNSEPLAAIIVTFYKNTATYYFGASSDSNRNLMAPYLLQWSAIRYAKNLGCRYYDFLGISPENSHKHKWAGVTEFKKKFGGTIVKYPCAREYIFRPFLYIVLVFAKRLRSLLQIVRH